MNGNRHHRNDGPTGSETWSEGQERLQRLIGPDYRLKWIIGRGGMSTVWLAEDRTPAGAGRDVAIKALRPEFSNAPEFLSRFRNEATAAEHLDSDNVVRTFDYREVPDPTGTVFCFIVMEYVRGESLADLLAREGSLDESLALDVFEQAAHGLAVIHRRGLVHRDIKPGNLMVTEDGVAKIADFGIAKAAEAVPLTRTGMVVGTAQYVSPEQAQGKEVTAASDVYSLGVVAYEMLSGRRPFTGDSQVSVVLAHINNPVPAMPTFVSPAARELVATALHKVPTDRYADGDELALAVAAVRRGARPPRPKSAGVSGRSQEPSPTASTQALAAVAQPTTVRPAADYGTDPDARAVGPGRVDAASAPERRPRNLPARKRRGGGFVTGLLIAVVLAALAGAGLLAARAGLFDGGSGTPSTQRETVVTETVTPTETTTTSRQPTSRPATTTRDEHTETSPQDTEVEEPTQTSRRPDAGTPAPEPSRPERPGVDRTDDGGAVITVPSEIADPLGDVLGEGPADATGGTGRSGQGAGTTGGDGGAL